MGSPTRGADYGDKLVRGARLNVLGTIAKVLHPVYLLVAARLYGPDTIGLYLLAVPIVELATSIAVGGVKDGIVMFGGRGDHLHDAEHRARVYRVLANALIVVTICSVASAVAVAMAGPELVDMIFTYDASAASTGARIRAVLPLLVLTLPCIAFMEIGVAATKSLMMMEYDTYIIGFLRPLMLLVFSVVAWFYWPGLEGLLVAYLVSHALLAIAAIWAFARHFSLVELGKALLHLEIDGRLLAFALPQSLNLTLNNFITHVDKLMLGYFGVAPELIGFYGIGAALIRNVRHARLAFMGAFSPIIARLHAEGRIALLEEHVGVVARWSLTIAIPVLLLLVGLRQELLLLFHHSFTDDASFMILLALHPLVGCWIGVAGNIVVMTGHSRWNLFNSLVVGLTNASLNALWIPRWGLWGAALATALAAVFVSILQLVEARRLVGVRVRFDLVRKPLLAGMAAAFVLAVHGLWEIAPILRVGTTALAVCAYVFLLHRLGLDPRDRDLLRFRKPRLPDM